MANMSLSLAYLLCVSVCANHVLWYTVKLIHGVRQHCQCVYLHTMCHSTMHMVHGVHKQIHLVQWRTQEFFSGGGSTNSVEDRRNGDLAAIAP